MNWHEEKQEAKRQRLRERAATKAAEAEKTSAEGWERLRAIPFGQPILVGHHSEKSDRSYRARAVRKIDKGFELSNQAAEMEARADRIGSGGISSDDPEAIIKLEAKLAGCQEGHAIMIQKNREARANGQEKPFPAYAISNSGANIRSIAKRIEDLQASGNTKESEPVQGNGWAMREDKDENRIMFVFNAIPSEEQRALLKSRAFKWSPTRKAWVRQITPNARFAADQIIKESIR